MSAAGQSSAREVGPLAEERHVRLALSLVAEPGHVAMQRALQEHGALQLYERLRVQEDLTGPSDVARALAAVDAESMLADARNRGIRFLIPGDPEWPDGLEALDRCEPLQGRVGQPLGLWVRGGGRLEELTERSVAVVGSRSATTYGTGVAGQIGRVLAAEGWTVVSGAAFGIDQAGHRGALALRRPTIAVLACGVDRAYPAAHARLLDLVAEDGVVVSELAPGCAPTKLRFLARNRVIAALASGTVVVEAAIRSGALNTASWTERLGRPLMAVPGPVTSEPSAGAHQLVRTRAALLVTDGMEVLEAVAPMGRYTRPDPREPERPVDRLSLLQRQVLDAVPVLDAVRAPAIARTAGLAVHDVRRALDQMRAQGFVEEVSGAWRLGERARP